MSRDAMMFMLDTDICIYPINERDETLRSRFEAKANGTCISAITHTELRYGAAHSVCVEENNPEIEAFCLDLDILSFDVAAGVHYGEIRQAPVPRGRPIGAHARSAGDTLVTNNDREFGRVPGLRMQNWLEEAAR